MNKATPKTKSNILIIVYCLIFNLVVVNSQEKKIIILDPGHGYCSGSGNDQSCMSTVRCHSEIQTALDVSLKLKEYLVDCENIKVFMTRKAADHKDGEPDLFKRAYLANKLKAKLFLSIHCNASGKIKGEDNCTISPNGATGTETFWCDKNKAVNNIEDSINLANTIQKEMAVNGELKDRRSMEFYKYNKRFHLGVLSPLKVPGVLSEIAFVDSKDKLKLEDKVWQDKFAKAYFNSIHDFLSLNCH